jgi:hypothetical protein
MTRTATTTILTTVILIAAGTLATAAECTDTTVAIGGDTCCFNNARYTGTCEVTTGPDETCSDVLAYLNNQASVGKTYCGNTKVRGGWSQVACEASRSPVTEPETTPES